MTNPEQAVDAALREARDNALEEAARVCDAYQHRAVLHFDAARALAAAHVAAHIRALKSQEQDNG